MVADRILETYQKKLSSDYSIIIVANTKISMDLIDDNINNIQSLKIIETNDILQNLEKTISKPNLSLLKTSLPYFYKLQLNNLPTKTELSNIERELLRLPVISKVETFEKTHNKIYQMFQLNKSIISFFAILLIFISSFLIFKQIQVWQYQHLERIKIMSLFGASLYMKSKSLITSSVINSFISSFAVSIFFIWLSFNKSIKQFLDDLGISSLEFNFFPDFLYLLLLSLTVSAIILVMILLRQNDDE
jgi:cell division transport system permease protein